MTDFANISGTVFFFDKKCIAWNFHKSNIKKESSITSELNLFYRVEEPNWLKIMIYIMNVFFIRKRKKYEGIFK